MHSNPQSSTWRNVFSGKKIEYLGRVCGVWAVVECQDERVVRRLAEMLDDVRAVADRVALPVDGVADELACDRVDQSHRGQRGKLGCIRVDCCRFAQRLADEGRIGRAG